MDVDVKHAGFTHVSFEITDVEAVESHLEKLGIPITERVEFDGAKFFFIRDPDGNVLEFHKPAQDA
jgi:lactoylglutathione lyase